MIATEARKLALSNNNNDENIKEFDGILSHIKQAAEAGKFELVCDGELKDFYKSKLLSLGYSTSTQYHSIVSFSVINW